MLGYELEPDHDVVALREEEEERFAAWQEEQARLEYTERYCLDEDLESDYHDTDLETDPFYDDDGQPDEAQEWTDFDPDC